MATTYDPNTQVKSEIFKIICSSSDIVALLTNTTTPTVPNKALMYTQVWPYMRVTECCKQANTHICFDIIINEADSAHVKGLEMIFILLTQDSLMRTELGTRLDRLEREILEVFNGSRGFGIGRVFLKKSRPNDSGDLADGWHWRRVTFEVKDFNLKADDSIWA